MHKNSPNLVTLVVDLAKRRQVGCVSTYIDLGETMTTVKMHNRK
jgi:hypothetical protein